jgi:hypothetical protein
MSTLHSFDSPILEEEYEYTGLLSQKSKSLILEFEHKTTGDTFIVKCIPNENEVNISKKVAQMRTKLKDAVGAQFIQLLYYFQIKDPFKTYQIERKKNSFFIENKECYAIMMESVSVSFKGMEFDAKDAISLGFELLYTIWIARREFQFFHGDLQSSNIMFKEAEDRQKRRYKVGGKTFLIESEMIPVIIDFEMSRFGDNNSEKEEKLSDTRRIIDVMRDAFQSTGISEPDAFRTLYYKVRQESFQKTDNRFNADTIEKILTDPDGVFNSLIEKEGVGGGGAGGESSLKKLKYCVGCKVVEAQLMCNACGIAVCSKSCWESIDSCLKKHTGRHRNSDSSNKN